MARHDKKAMSYKFEETSLAIDASLEFDQIEESEAQVNCGLFMKERERGL